MTALQRTVLLAVVLLLAGCAAAPPGAVTTTTTTPTAGAPLGAEAATDRALDAEHEYVFAEKVPADATERGTGGLASPRAVAVAETEAGRVVRVRYGFWYETNTSEGTLHADGVSQAVYFVTPSDATRVSYRGHEMKGSGVPSTEATLRVHVANAASDPRTVSVTVTQPDTTHYRAETTVVPQASAASPRLGVPGDEATVAATVDGTTHRETVALPEAGQPVDVLVFATPDGTVVLATAPRL